MSSEERERSRVILFKEGVTTVPFEDDNGTTYQRVVDSFRVPSLIDVDGVMVAIADARYNSDNDNSFIETVVKYSVDDGKTWETQIAVKNTRVSNVSRVVDPTVIVKGNKIYMLLGRYNKSKTYWNQQYDGKDWEPVFSVGEVKKTTINGKVNATITWTDPVSLKSIFPKEIAGGPSKQFLGGVGVSIVTTNGTLVFPVQAMNTNKEITAMIMYSKDGGDTWKFANGITALGCTESSILEWEGKIILNARVDKGFRKVFESTDLGETWTEAVGTLSRVWGNSPKRKGPGSQGPFIPVTIEGKRVILFTQPQNYKESFKRDRLHLWVTDNNRIFNVGQISVDDENAPYSSVLYRDDKLYILHEKNIRAYSLIFLELKEELNLIKSVVKTWIEQDKNFSDICTPVDPKKLSVVASDCGLPFPTAGLVGFLSDGGDSEQWKDAYRCVDASVKNGEKVLNGMRFKGVGAGALWPVGKQGQNQRYHFANYMFTLVATVQIIDLPKAGNPVPLLGVSLDEAGGKKVLGLSFNSDQQWNPIYGKFEAAPTGSWERKKTYQVALTFEHGVGSIYVDGEPLAGSGERLQYDTDSPVVSHFYIGGYGNRKLKTDGHVTVTNVLLYNRQLNQSELKTLFLARDFISSNKPEGSGSLETDGSTLCFGVNCFSMMLLPLLTLALVLFDHGIFI
ncbi:Chain A, Orthorhombic Form Sialidase 648 [Trypanosoma theileri]|uniref:Chain A, Orthorhombic Form Sialidase 648 n=1 Tax=Trypanosoma theileri TaxID=67003 RepID=A0A1X0NG76_9TRYP|nr:Chain A, Orthorhombic Form Sialidase 648 [Trypanosoma theileri]ORC83732.1 Chain A, Orthorhombic Form Sialidase 648 [Trypanosoma theileri]